LSSQSKCSKGLRILSCASLKKLKRSHLLALSVLTLSACQTPKFQSTPEPGNSSPVASTWVQKPPPLDRLATTPTLERLAWEGRVQIEVDTAPLTKLSGPFALEMSGDQGSLRLMGPLGSTAALLTWGKNWATLQSSQLKPKEQHFSSLSDLMQNWLGSPIELEELMPGLLGQESTHAGWRFESNMGRTKVAQRLFPAPAVNIKLILDETQTTP